MWRIAMRGERLRRLCVALALPMLVLTAYWAFAAPADPAQTAKAPEKSAVGPPANPAAPATEKQPVRVLVAYYSLTGNTQRLSQGVVEGVQRVPGVVAVAKKAEDVTKEDLQAAQGIILGCPTYYGNIPGKMMVVIDDWSWKMKVDFTDKVGGAFATGGGQTGGKEHVVISLLLFMLNNRMVVAGPLYQDAEGDDLWAETGATAMTGPLDPGIGPNDLDGARRLGDRVARLAKRRTPQ